MSRSPSGLVRAYTGLLEGPAGLGYGVPIRPCAFLQHGPGAASAKGASGEEWQQVVSHPEGHSTMFADHTQVFVSHAGLPGDGIRIAVSWGS